MTRRAWRRFVDDMRSYCMDMTEVNDEMIRISYKIETESQRLVALYSAQDFIKSCSDKVGTKYIELKEYASEIVVIVKYDPSLSQDEKDFLDDCGVNKIYQKRDCLDSWAKFINEQ